MPRSECGEHDLTENLSPSGVRELGADIRLVFHRERIWRILKDGKANDVLR